MSVIVTPEKLLDATWIPHPKPEGEQTHLLDWTSYDPPRKIVAVRTYEGVFVIARDISNQIRETFKVLGFK